MPAVLGIFESLVISKMKRVFPLVLSLVALFAAVSCSSTKSDSVGVRTDALDDALWAQSEWISVADAPVIDGLVRSSINYRAADGASWFVAEPVNESKVSSAKWMTALKSSRSFLTLS